MKKIFSSILISFILFTNLVLPVSVLASSTWSYLVTYKTNNIESTNDTFTSLEACNTERTALMNSAEYKNNPNVYNVPSECVEKKDPAVSVTPKMNVAENKSIYKMLVPLPGITCMDSSGQDPNCIPNDIGKYLNFIFKFAIGLCAALAVIMLIIAGVSYMGDESVFGKTEAKKKMFSAILGLIIALGAWALLNTINPALTGKGGLVIDTASVEIAGDTEAPTIFNRNTLPTGIICEGGKQNIPNIAKSFDKKMTYEMGAKGVAGPQNTIKLDCSGFVNYVLDCAGSNFVSGGTISIFSSAEKVTSISGTKVNAVDLKIGDLVGWRAGENGEKFGHVMIYVGEGNVQVADSHGTKIIGGALGIFPITQYQPRIKYIKRIP